MFSRVNIHCMNESQFQKWKIKRGRKETVSLFFTSKPTLRTSMVDQNSFLAISKTQILVCHHNHFLSSDATIMVSKNCSITGEHVGFVFVTQ